MPSLFFEQSANLARTLLNLDYTRIVPELQALHLSPLVKALSQAIIGLYAGDVVSAGEAADYLRASQAELSAIDAICNPHDTVDWSAVLVSSKRTVFKYLLALLESRAVNPRVYTYFTSRRTASVPFIEFDTEPLLIGQLKKIVNLCYYTERTLLFIEAYNIDTLPLAEGAEIASLLAFEALGTPIQSDAFTNESLRFIEHAYQALQCLQQLDIDLSALMAFAPLDFNAHLIPFMPQATRVAHRAGQLSGYAMHRVGPMQPREHALLIKTLGVDAWNGVHAMTHWMQRFLHPATLNESFDVDAEPPLFTDVCLHSMLAAWHARQDKLVLDNGVNVIHWFEILRYGYELVISIWQETVRLSPASAAMLSNHVAAFKYDYLAPLVALLNELEDELALHPPGQLSTLLLNYIEPQYTMLHTWIVSLVDGYVIRSDLARVNDALFTARLVAYRQEKCAVRQVSLVWLVEVETIARQFFRLLEPYRAMRLRELPSPIRLDAAHHYQLIRPELDRLDSTLGYLLTQAFSDTYAVDHLSMPLFEADQIESVMALEPKLALYVQQRRNTVRFQHELALDAINYTYASLDSVPLHAHDVSVNSIAVRLEASGQYSVAQMRAQRQHTPVLRSAVAESRRMYWVKYPMYSELIEQLEERLRQVRDLFNARLLEAITATGSNLLNSPPFPQLVDATGKRRDCPEIPEQVLAFQCVSNGLFYVKQAALRFEELHESNSTLLEKLHHLNQVRLLRWDLLCAASYWQALPTNTYVMELMGDVSRTMLQLHQVLHALIKPHQLHTMDNQQVASRRLLHMVHPLLMGFTQLQVGPMLSALPSIQVTIVRNASIRATRVLERILNTASVPFRLLFELPALYRFYQRIQTALHAFSTRTHERGDLARFHDEIMANIVLEADAWEARLELRSGLLSEPIHQVLDAYYQGLIEPLVHDSREYLLLVTSQVISTKRMQANALRIEHARYRLDVAQSSSMRVTTQQLVLDCAVEQARCVEAQAVAHALSAPEKMADYIRSRMHHARMHSPCLPKLNHAKAAYLNALRAHIDAQETTWMACIRPDNPILPQVKAQLAQQTHAFNATCLDEFYQYERLGELIQRFKHYVVQCTHAMTETPKGLWFEDQCTLRAKALLLANLERAYMGSINPMTPKDSLTESLRRVRAYVSRPEFQTQLLDCKSYEPWTFGWLVDWFCQVLDLLGCHVRESRLLFNQFSLFARASTRPGDASVEVLPDDAWSCAAPNV